jgi:hypothetical protein
MEQYVMRDLNKEEKRYRRHHTVLGYIIKKKSIDLGE